MSKYLSSLLLIYARFQFFFLLFYVTHLVYLFKNLQNITGLFCHFIFVIKLKLKNVLKVLLIKNNELNDYKIE